MGMLGSKEIWKNEKRKGNGKLIEREKRVEDSGKQRDNMKNPQ